MLFLKDEANVNIQYIKNTPYTSMSDNVFENTLIYTNNGSNVKFTDVPLILAYELVLRSLKPRL